MAWSEAYHSVIMLLLLTPPQALLYLKNNIWVCTVGRIIGTEERGGHGEQPVQERGTWGAACERATKSA